MLYARGRGADAIKKILPRYMVKCNLPNIGLSKLVVNRFRSLGGQTYFEQKLKLIWIFW